jgi:fatty-acyl-CoA synthase
VRLTEPVPEAELRAHCAAGIAGFKVPARFVAVETFPTVDGPNGVKIRKRELRDEATRLLDRTE